MLMGLTNEAPSAVESCVRLSSPVLRRIGHAFLAMWAPLAFVVAGTLALGHWWTLPKPDVNNETVRVALYDRWQRDRVPGWTSVHVLYSQCRCSERILHHLAARGPMTDVSEVVILVGSNAAYEESIRRAGYRLEVVTPAQLLERYHFEAAPMFAVMDPFGALRYLGGYTERQQGFDIRDVSIMERLTRHQSVSELPLFGCAVSRSLQALLDPLGIKYSNDVEL
jgi:hypothetical protein